MDKYTSCLFVGRSVTFTRVLSLTCIKLASYGSIYANLCVNFFRKIIHSGRLQPTETEMPTLVEEIEFDGFGNGTPLVSACFVVLFILTRWRVPVQKRSVHVQPSLDNFFFFLVLTHPRKAHTKEKKGFQLHIFLPLLSLTCSVHP